MKYADTHFLLTSPFLLAKSVFSLVTSSIWWFQTSCILFITATDDRNWVNWMFWHTILVSFWQIKMVEQNFCTSYYMWAAEIQLNHVESIWNRWSWPNHWPVENLGAMIEPMVLGSPHFKPWFISPITMVYGIYNQLVTGVNEFSGPIFFKNQPESGLVDPLGPKTWRLDCCIADLDPHVAFAEQHFLWVLGVQPGWRNSRLRNTGFTRNL